MSNGTKEDGLRIIPLADAAVIDVRSGPQTVVVEPSPAHPEFVSVITQLEGDVDIELQDRGCTLAPGHLTLVNSTQPIRITFECPFRQVFTLVRAKRIGLLPPAVYAQVLDGSRGADRMLFDHVRAYRTQHPHWTQDNSTSASTL